MQPDFMKEISFLHWKLLEDHLTAIYPTGPRPFHVNSEGWHLRGRLFKVNIVVYPSVFLLVKYACMTIFKN